MDIVANPRAYFDALFAADADPWKFRQRWYEERKRALTLACLRRSRYARAFEPGCANGELSAALAPRCDRLLISDGVEAALASARDRVADQPHVSVTCGWVPDEWPEGVFDLIVLSEVVYYLTDDAIDRLAARVGESLLHGGDLVACHWRRPIEGCRLVGDAAHARLTRALRLTPVWSLIDPDFRLEIWSSDANTVAEREGLL